MLAYVESFLVRRMLCAVPTNNLNRIFSTLVQQLRDDLPVAEAVRKALSGLSEEQREALVLARYHGMPYVEIAQVLGISVGAVKTRIFRAVETLKSHFSEGERAWNAAN